MIKGSDMAMNLKNKYNQTIGWLLSYLLVFLIPFVVGCLVYISSENVIKSDVYDMNKYILRQIQNEFDDLTGDVYSLSRQIQTNRQILNISELEQISNTDRLSIINSVDDLIKYKSTSDVDNFFVYFGKSDSIISYKGYFETDDIYDILPDRNKEDTQVWEKIKSGKLNDKVFPYGQCQSSEGSSCVTYCVPLNNTGSYIIAQISPKRYEKIISQLYPESIYFIFDNDNNVIYNSLNTINLDNVISAVNDEKDTIRFNGNTYFVNTIMSSVNSIKYCGIISKRTAYKNIIKTRTIMFLGFGICLLLGILFSIYFVKKNFKPIRDISKILISQRLITLKGINEESKLISVLNDVIGSKISAEQKLLKQKNYVISAATSMLLNNKFENDITCEKFRQICEIDLSEKYYAVIVFNSCGGQNNAEINGYELQLFVIKNIFEELLAEKYTAYVTDVNGVICGVLNFDDLDGYNENLDNIVELGKSTLKEYFNLDIVVSSGSVKHDIKNLYESFNEAMYTMNNTAENGDLQNCTDAKMAINEEDVVVKALNIIHSEYYSLDLNVAYIAEKLSMSVSYLSRTFSSRMGEGILNYINKYRIEKSKEYLLNKDLTLESIIEMVGFSSCNTYIRVFKKYSGITPGKWRENKNI